MADKCENCPYVETINELKEQSKELEKRTSKLESRADVSDTKHDAVIEKIEDVKQLVTTFTSKMENLVDTIVVEFKKGIKEVDEKIDKEASKPNEWKKFVYDLGLDLLKVGVIGGALWYAFNK